MKIKEKAEARRFRIENGFTVNKIAKLLKVAKSSVSVWVRDLPLKKEQIDKIAKTSRAFPQQLKGSAKMVEKYRNIRLQYQEEGIAKAKENDPLHIQACMLYWAEGTKDQTQLCFTNTDVNMMILFITFIRTHFQAKNDDFRLFFNCYVDNGLSFEDIKNYWLFNLKLSESSVRNKNSIKLLEKDNGKKNKHPYGVCCLYVKNSCKILQHIYGAIKQYAGMKDYYKLG